MESVGAKSKKYLPIMRQKQVVGSIQAGDKWTHPIYLDDGRLPGFAEIVGEMKDSKFLELLTTGKGFRSLVEGIGVTLWNVPGKPAPTEPVQFSLQLYGKTDRYQSGTCFQMPLQADGEEHYLPFEEGDWSEDDDRPGQIRFTFASVYETAMTDVKLYMKGDWELPLIQPERDIDRTSKVYNQMIASSLMQLGNTERIHNLFRKAERGEEVTLAFIGGSITQGAGATPLPENCYAHKTYEGFLNLCESLSGDTAIIDRNKIHFCKAGVGGTSSELGMIRYDRDVVRGKSADPDLVVIEFAVNDDGDETKGVCYESLVRKILLSPGKPAVILLFSVFANCWNLQDRLSPIGKAYQLPMVSVKDAVAKQFDAPWEQRLVTRNQYFYDRLHPNNMGHTIMADCLLHYLKTAALTQCEGEEPDIRAISPVIGDAFTQIKLLDKKAVFSKAVIEEGSFDQRDEVLQGVEMDTDMLPTKEFPYNWKHVKGSEPFRMSITCTGLVLVFKDSDENTAGKANVWADGQLILTADPRKNGWVHCNPVILFTGWEKREHYIEIKMDPDEEEKEFTILGFGYVE
jgi:lysophospholipase L1-like esterase